MSDQDIDMLKIMKRTRQSISAAALEDTSGRISEIAIESLQSAIVQMESAMAREDMEELEARETLQEFRQARGQAIRLLGNMLGLLRRALYAPGSDLPQMRQARTRLRDLLDEHSIEALNMETTDSLSALAEQMQHLLPVFIPVLDERMDVDQTTQTLLVSVDTLTLAQQEFMREESQYVDAQRQLADARQEAYITMLNVRDLMRAALRAAHQVDQLNAIVPPLAESMAHQHAHE